MKKKKIYYHVQCPHPFIELGNCMSHLIFILLNYVNNNFVWQSICEVQ